MDLDELLLGDSDDENKKSKPKVVDSLLKDNMSILKPSYGVHQKNIEEMTNSSNEPKIIIPINEDNEAKNQKKEENNSGNALANFIFGNEPIQKNINSNPSSFSSQGKEFKPIKVEAKIPQKIKNSSIIIDPIIEEPKEIIIFDERKEYENKKEEYLEQNKNIKLAYSYDINKKIQDYKNIERNYKEEIEKLEKRYSNELKDQENNYNEKKERYKTKISEIEKERTRKLKELQVSQEEFFQQELEQLENEFKLNKENIESDYKLELDKINNELGVIKENKSQIFKEELSSRRIDDIYSEIYKKINSGNNDIELNSQLKKTELLKRDLMSESDNLSRQIKRIKENTEYYENKISEKKSEIEEILVKIEIEINEVRNKENDLETNKEKLKDFFQGRQNALNMSEKEMEAKYQEELKSYNLDLELKNEENILNHEKELFEKAKNDFKKYLEDENNELKDETEKIEKKELEIENKINNIKISEIQINNEFSHVENLNNDISIEKENIQKEKYNMELMEKRIQNDIQILNEDKQNLEKEKERIKNLIMEIEQEERRLNEEDKKIREENRLFDLRNKAVENMRINNILNNNYENNINNFEQIGQKTMPNFGNNVKNINNFSKTDGFKQKNNFAQTFSLFNQGGKKMNADEYFGKIIRDIEDKKLDENQNEYDINNYIINGNNFIKEKREQLKEIENI